MQGFNAFGVEYCWSRIEYRRMLHYPSILLVSDSVSIGVHLVYVHLLRSAIATFSFEEFALQFVLRVKKVEPRGILWLLDLYRHVRDLSIADTVQPIFSACISTLGKEPYSSIVGRVF